MLSRDTLMQLPDKGRMQHAKIVFEEPSIGEWHLAARRGTPLQQGVYAFNQFLGQVRELADKGRASAGLNQAHSVMDLGCVPAGFDFTAYAVLGCTAGWYK